MPSSILDAPRINVLPAVPNGRFSFRVAVGMRTRSSTKAGYAARNATRSSM